jgi:hypothetical protein
LAVKCGDKIGWGGGGPKTEGIKNEREIARASKIERENGKRKE